MARSGETGQNASSMRRRLRSAVSHKKLADELLDSIQDSQDKLNATLDKLDADTAGALDTDYEATGEITDLFEADGESTDAQHKQSLRRSLRSALAHRHMADEIADSIEEWQASYNSWLQKLDAEGGTLNDTDYVSSLGVDAIDSDAAGEDAQHGQSFRRSMESAMADRSLSDAVLDAISGMQEAMNASMALLDAGTVNGAHATLKVSPIDPD